MNKQILGIVVLTTVFFLFGLRAEASIIRVPGDFEHIGEALEAAEPGANIIVHSGSYRENIVIKKPVFLRSSRGALKTTIIAADPSKPAIHVKDTRDVSILAFTIKGSDIAGVIAEKTKNLKVLHNIITENENGLLGLTIEGCNIFSNNLDENNSYGLYLNESRSCRVRSNSISRNRDKGIFLHGSNYNAILDNQVNLNKWNGMLIWSSNNNVIKGNRTLRNMFGFVTGESSDNEVADNTSLPDLFLILPVLLVYLGFIFYLIQLYLFKTIYGR